MNDVLNSGFDEFYGLLSGAFGGINAAGYGGVDTWDPIDSRKGGADPRNPTLEFAGSAMVSRAIQFIQEAEEAGEPYFMAYDVLEPHFEYEVAPGPLEAPPAGFAGDWRTLDPVTHRGRDRSGDRRLSADRDGDARADDREPARESGGSPRSLSARGNTPGGEFRPERRGV